MAEDLGIPGLSEIVRIGDGGASTVYRARQDHLDRYVAIKVIRSGGEPADIRRRFAREQRAIGRMSGTPGIVPVYESGLTTHDEPYLVMPYYPAGSLDDRIRAGPTPPPAAVDLGARLADALALAHSRDVIHCDLKPANVLIDDSGDPQIADFGIAQLLDATVSRTSTSFTPAYAPPETLEGHEPSVSGDIYSLGATVHALLAGGAPFGRGDGNLLALVRRIASEPPADLRTAAVPDALATCIETAMSKDPAQRFDTAAEFADALRSSLKDTPRAVEDDTEVTIVRTSEGNRQPASGKTSVRREERTPGDASTKEAADDHVDGASTATPVAPTRLMEGAWDGAEAPDHPTPARRPRVKRVLAVLVVMVAAMAAGVTAIGSYARASHFVGFAETDQVVIFEGRPGGFLWLDPQLIEASTLLRDELSRALAAEVDDNPQFGSIEEARAYIAELRGRTEEATQSEAASAAPDPTPPDSPVVSAGNDGADQAVVAVNAFVEGATLVFSGTVTDQSTADALLLAAETVLGAGQATSELVVDPEASSANATIGLAGSVEETTGALLLAGLSDVLPDAVVDTTDLTLVASTDVIAELNALFAANPVQFAAASPEILPESAHVIDEIATLLRDAPGLALEIQGHTDNSGTAADNQVLSLDRAQQVLQLLVDAGVRADQLAAVGYGEDQPVANNDTPEGRQQNRRIEFAVIE